MAVAVQLGCAPSPASPWVIHVPLPGGNEASGEFSAIESSGSDFVAAQLLQEWFENQERHFSKQTPRGFQKNPKESLGVRPVPRACVPRDVLHLAVYLSEEKEASSCLWLPSEKPCGPQAELENGERWSFSF